LPAKDAEANGSKSQCRPSLPTPRDILWRRPPCTRRNRACRTRNWNRIDPQGTAGTFGKSSAHVRFDRWHLRPQNGTRLRIRSAKGSGDEFNIPFLQDRPADRNPECMSRGHPMRDSVRATFGFSGRNTQTRKLPRTGSLHSRNSRGTE